MPIHFEVKRTAKGREYIQTHTRGFVDEAQARDFTDRFREGGLYAGKPYIGVIASDTTYTVQSRKLFANGESNYSVVAFVAASAPLRVMLNFMIKASMVTNPRPAVARTFSLVGEAEAWLDEELDKLAVG